jgi:hypothetical protein
MKKFKISLTSLAVIAAVTSAFATKPPVMCDNQPQYYRVGSTYYEAGVLNLDYDCDYNDVEVCTYVLSGTSTYTPCKWGSFFLYGARKAK